MKFSTQHIPERGDGRRPLFNEPFFLQWHITDKCNLSCKHCYRDEKKKSLPKDELLKILDNFVEFLKKYELMGRIQFAGGEPLIRKDIFELIERVRDKKIPSRLLSNGTLLTEELAHRLRKSGVRIFQISIEGNRQTHDEIRGEGTFERSIEGSKLLRRVGIQVTFSTTLTKINLGQIKDVIKIARKDADRVSFHRLVPTGAGEELSKYLLTKEEWNEAMFQMIRLRKDIEIDFPLRDPTWRGWFFPPRIAQKTPSIAGCSAGYNQLTVESNGDVYPCRRLPIVIGNALDSNFIEIWKSEVLSKLRDRDLLEGKCKDCKLRWHCGGCRAIPYAMNGNYLAEDPQCFWSENLFSDKINQIKAGVFG